MASDLDKDLRELVLENWGLVRELHVHAVDVEKELIKRCQDAYAQSGNLEKYALSRENFVRSAAGGWFLAYPGAEHDYLSYTQVDVLADEPRFTMKVFTGFRSIKGIGVLELKRGALADVGDDASPDFDVSGGNCVLLNRQVELVNADDDAFVRRVAEEVAFHAPVAEALRRQVLARLGPAGSLE